jgi:hypothetical protein
MPPVAFTPLGEGVERCPHTNTINDQNPFPPSQHQHFDTLGLPPGFFILLNTFILLRKREGLRKKGVAERRVEETGDEEGMGRCRGEAS